MIELIAIGAVLGVCAVVAVIIWRFLCLFE